MNEGSPASSDERVLARMLVEGAISSQMHDAALAYAKRRGGRVEDAIIDGQILSERELLRILSTIHRTHFVSTQKLYEKEVSTQLLELVPRKLALSRCVLPVIYDAAKRALSIVTADPDDLAMINEVKVAAGVRDVVPILGRPAAVRAAVARAYENDPSGFRALVSDGDSLGLDVDRSAIPVSFGAKPFAVPERSAPEPAPVTHPPKPLPKAPPRANPPVEIPDTDVKSVPPQRPVRRPSNRRMNAVKPPPPITLATYLETLKLVVGMLEAGRPNLAGHSASCADLMKRLCTKMDLSPSTTAAYTIAAYLHDVGKAASHHLTAISVATDEGCKAAAKEYHDAPERVFKTVVLPPDVLPSIAHMYERFGGRGFPDDLSGERIPLGARLLAVVDAYADLTQSPRNPSGRVQDIAGALRLLGGYRGSLFDPVILDALEGEVTPPAMNDDDLPPALRF